MFILLGVLALIVFGGSFLLLGGVNLTNGLLAAIFLMLWAVLAQVGKYANEQLAHFRPPEEAPKHKP
jgi:hypothetical protein